MLFRQLTCFLLIISLFSTPLFAWEEADGCQCFFIRRFCDDVVRDYFIYYSKENLPCLGGVLLASGVMANTNIDRNIQTFWQKNIRSRTTYNFFKVPNDIGKFSYFRVYIGTMVLGSFRKDTVGSRVLFEWGYRALRTMLLISPQEVFLSWALGNGRPSDHQDSKWRFFGKGGNAGCSGHAFNGAVPFLTAAMMTDNPYYKVGLYTASFLPGLARINKDNHYFSQFVLGWAIAYLSTKAVDISEGFDIERFSIGIVPQQEGALIQAKFKF